MNKQDNTLTITDGPEDQYTRAQRLVGLRSMLESKGAGDRVTAAEIQEATGHDNWKSYRPAIQRWAQRKNLVLGRGTGDGWRFVDEKERADRARVVYAGARRQIKETARIVVGTDLSKLDEKDVRHAQFMINTVAPVVLATEHADQRIKEQLKLEQPRVPLRIASRK